MDNDLLIGRKEIMTWMRVDSWVTIKKLHRCGGLPIEKIEGRWTTRRQLLKEWIDVRVRQQPLPRDVKLSTTPT